MLRGILTCIFCCILVALNGQSTFYALPTSTAYTFHFPDQDKLSWQRLNLLQSSTFIVVVNEGQLDLDSCLYLASHSLKLSRYSILAEGIEDPDLLTQSQWIDIREPNKGVNQLSAAIGKKHLQLLVLLGAYYAFEPAYSLTSRERAVSFLTAAIRESKSLREGRVGRIAQCLLGKVYVEANDNKGDSIYARLINECRLAGDKQTEARALAYRGRYTLPMAATLNSKVKDMEQAAELYHKQYNIEGEINALTDIGYLKTITAQLEPAEEFFSKALRVADSIHYPYTHYNLDALAMITGFRGKFGEPLNYAHQTIKIAERCRDSIGLGQFYSRLASLYQIEDKVTEAQNLRQKALNIYLMQYDPNVYPLIMDLTNTMCEEGRAKEQLTFIEEIAKKVNPDRTITTQFLYHAALSVCYLTLNRLEPAEMNIRLMDSLETTAEAIRGPLRRAMVNDLLGALYRKRGEYAKARDMYEKHFTEPSIAMHVFDVDLDAYRNLIELDSILGDNAAGIIHYKKYMQLSDSVFKVTRLRQAEELQLTYQTQEKENQIAILTQQTALEKSNSEKATLVRNLTIAGIIAVLIIAVLLYRQSSLRKRNNLMITEKNAQLQQLLDDKEWLLKEVHHRVKNNLQIIMSLLDSQSEYISNDAALAAIEDNMRRVHAMALIHQKLYQSDDVASIAMPEYINELVNYARESFDTGNRISFEQSVEALTLDVSQVIPIGLIINESIVNAIKYAFPNGRKGTVQISFYQDWPDHLILKISDNGIGLPEQFNTKAHTSLGLELMQGLTRQLNGVFNFENNNGLHITIRFIIFKNHLSHNSLINV